MSGADPFGSLLDGYKEGVAFNLAIENQKRAEKLERERQETQRLRNIGLSIDNQISKSNFDEFISGKAARGELAALELGKKQMDLNRLSETQQAFIEAENAKNKAVSQFSGPKAQGEIDYKKSLIEDIGINNRTDQQRIAAMNNRAAASRAGKIFVQDGRVMQYTPSGVEDVTEIYNRSQSPQTQDLAPDATAPAQADFNALFGLPSAQPPAPSGSVDASSREQEDPFGFGSAYDEEAVPPAPKPTATDPDSLRRAALQLMQSTGS